MLWVSSLGPAGILGGGVNVQRFLPLSKAPNPQPLHTWLPTAPGVCSQCVWVHCCVCALWMGKLQSTKSKYGSTYLAVCHVTFIRLLQAEQEWKVLLLLNAFSPVNETWGNLTTLHSILHECCLSLYHWLASGLSVRIHVFWRRRGFGERVAGKVGSYAFRDCLLLLASPKSPTLLSGETEDPGAKVSSCNGFYWRINTGSLSSNDTEPEQTQSR